MEEPKSPAVASSTWPGAFGAYKPSAEAVKRNLNVFLVLWGVLIVGNILSGAIFGQRSSGQSLVSALIDAFAGVGLVLTTLASLRGKTLEVADVIKRSWPQFLNLFVLQVLVALTVIAGLVLLIVPGLIAIARFSLASYFLIDKNMSIIDAYKASWHATKGHSWKVWGLIGVSALMALPIITIVGILLTLYWIFMYQAAVGLLYLYLAKK